MDGVSFFDFFEKLMWKAFFVDLKSFLLSGFFKKIYFLSFSLEKRRKKSIVLLVTNLIGESSNGRTPDFDSVCLGSNPSSPGFGLLLRSRETVSRRAHNPKIGGSIPSSATKEYL